MSELKLCALQIGTLALSNSRLDYYLQTAAKSGAKVVLLGEYVINSFFAELELMPKSMIKEQSESKKKALAELAIKYDLHIIAPIVLVKPKEYVKCQKSQTTIKNVFRHFIFLLFFWVKVLRDVARHLKFHRGYE